MKYFYADSNNQSVGPHTAEELAQLIKEGKIKPDTYIIAEGSAEWKTYSSTFPPTASAASPTASTKPLTPAMAVLWFICCLAIGFMQWGQTVKGWCWILASFVTGGLAAIPAMVDYWMCYVVQQKRTLGEWEFFPTK